MKRLKVVAWDILNKASIQVGALKGWVYVNTIRNTFSKFVFFCNFTLHYRIKKIGVVLLKNRSTRMTRRIIPTFLYTDGIRDPGVPSDLDALLRPHRRNNAQARRRRNSIEVFESMSQLLKKRFVALQLYIDNVRPSNDRYAISISEVRSRSL